ncbi:hypothetical protein Pelo_14703 [Pelomyxa schiedti]|nr:hypothetical protein Pelo_14703 [Pelomyxa schiedti]
MPQGTHIERVVIAPLVALSLLITVAWGNSLTQGYDNSRNVKAAPVVGAPTSYTTYLCGGVPVDSDNVASCTQTVTTVTTKAIGVIGSMNQLVQTDDRDDYAYRPGYYIDSTGGVQDYSVFDVDDIGTTFKMHSEFSGFNSIMLNSVTSYTIEDSVIEDVTDADGKDTCDFSGLGAAVAVFGGTKLTIFNTTIYVQGVSKLGVMVDSACEVTIESSKVTSYGGTLYSDYQNMAWPAYMVSPPWVLGIMGTSRCTSLYGNYATMHVIDSDMAAAQWAVLSTDSCSKPMLNVVNSKISHLGADYPLQQPNSDGTVLYQTPNPYTNRSGYGTYIIGDAKMYWYGVTADVGTYMGIFTGGTSTWTSLTAGETYTLYDAYGSASRTYTATESKVTTINSDTFGFMAHQGSSNTAVIEKGTVVNSGWTGILVKTGCSASFSVTSGSVITPGNGILLQVLDNDDTTTGVADPSTTTFNTNHTEAAGWPTATSTGSSNTVSLTLDDVTLSGDIYNGAGYYGQQAPTLKVTLSTGATLNAAIAATATIHVTYEGNVAISQAKVKASEDWLAYQNTFFTISEYFDLGQVANKLYYNTHNKVAVTVNSGCTWVVTAESLLTSLTNKGTIYGTITTNSDGTISVVPSSTVMARGSW